MNYGNSEICSPPLSDVDLDGCFGQLGESEWRWLSGKRLFITGGTGFVGKWLLATLIYANRRLGLGCRICVLSRDPNAFLAASPELASDPIITFVKGDVQSFIFPESRFDIVIHAATDVAAKTRPESIFATCVQGTKHVFSFARHVKAKDVLLVSSGAVYGAQPHDLLHIPETYLGGPNPLLPEPAYGEGKRASEWLACTAGHGAHMRVKIARCFALVGPHLPLDKHFAAGNFLKAAMAGDDIVIEGDGTPYRSYLYAAAMAAWLWAILVKGKSGVAYNVGSEEGLTIKALAERIASVLNKSSAIHIRTPAQPGAVPQRYVPSCEKVRRELGLPLPLLLDDAIVRTGRRLHSRFPACEVRE